VGKKDKPVPEVFEALEREESDSGDVTRNGNRVMAGAGLTSVLEMKTGSKGEIVSIAPHQNGRIERLSALGIIAGNTIELVQKQPSLVVKVDHTEIALDREIAGGIFIRNEGQ
jgi:Fe2+ transport system protein FeoA